MVHRIQHGLTLSRFFRGVVVIIGTFRLLEVRHEKVHSKFFGNIVMTGNNNAMSIPENRVAQFIN